MAISDSPNQQGGEKPINYFGRPRPRWMFVLAFIYMPIAFLIAPSVIWYDLPWCPTLLRPPQFFLVLAALLSGLTASLVYQEIQGYDKGSKPVWEFDCACHIGIFRAFDRHATVSSV